MVLDKGMALGNACDRAVPGMGFGAASSYWSMCRADVDDLGGSPFGGVATAAFSCSKSWRCEVPML